MCVCWGAYFYLLLVLLEIFFFKITHFIFLKPTVTVGEKKVPALCLKKSYCKLRKLQLSANARLIIYYQAISCFTSKNTF